MRKKTKNIQKMNYNDKKLRIYGKRQMIAEYEKQIDYYLKIVDGMSAKLIVAGYNPAIRELYQY